MFIAGEQYIRSHLEQESKAANKVYKLHFDLVNDGFL
jgi:hypothetical protein